MTGENTHIATKGLYSNWIGSHYYAGSLTFRDGLLEVGADGISEAWTDPARTVFNNLSNQYATPHTDIAFQNEVVDQFYSLSEDCFTCHVSFDYLLKTKVGVQTDPAAYTFCIIQQDGNGRLYNLLMS